MSVPFLSRVSLFSQKGCFSFCPRITTSLYRLGILWWHDAENSLPFIGAAQSSLAISILKKKYLKKYGLRNNPRRAAGCLNTPPPCGFSSISQKRRRSAPPFLAYLFVHLFRTCENFTPCGRFHKVGSILHQGVFYAPRNYTLLELGGFIKNRGFSMRQLYAFVCFGLYFTISTT